MIYIKILKAIGKAFILTIVLSGLAVMFYNSAASKPFNLSESIIVIRCFLIYELIFQKSLYNLTSDPFDFLAIHFGLSPYYFAFTLYLFLIGRLSNVKNGKYMTLISPFLVSFGSIGTIGGLLFGYLESRSSLGQPIKMFFMFGGINLTGLLLQGISLMKQNEVLLRKSVFIMFILNCLSIIAMMNFIISDTIWKYDFKQF